MNKADTELGAKAEAQIHLAIRRLGTKYVFHSRVLERFILRNLPNLPTMGVSVLGDNVMLAYNAQFVLDLPLDQLLGVLLHEVHHVLFKHILLDPSDFANQAALTVAAELVVNEFVYEPLPKGVITLAMYPKFPPMESTIERYRRLEKLVSPLVVKPLKLPLGSRPRRSGSGGRSIPEVVDEHSVWADGLEGFGEPNGVDGSKKPGHDKRAAEATVDNLIQNAAHDVGPDNLPYYVKHILSGRWAGSQPGNALEDIEPTRGVMDWVKLLRRHVGQAVEASADYRRPARRFSHLVGIVPGKRRISQRPRIMAVIDSSGSMTYEILARISGELGIMAARYRVTIVECDCAIQKVYEYRPITTVSGRGGTSFSPPLEWSFLARHSPDLIIFFTDGFGEAPDHPPRVPVIWCLTPGGLQPTPWGRLIQMEQPR